MELRDDPAVGEAIVGDDRITVVVNLAAAAESRPQRVERNRAEHNHAARLVEHGEIGVDGFDDVVGADRGVGVRRRRIDRERSAGARDAVPDAVEVRHRRRGKRRGEARSRRLQHGVRAKRRDARRRNAAHRLGFQHADVAWPGQHLAERWRHIVVRVAVDLRSTTLREHGRRQREKHDQGVTQSEHFVVLLAGAGETLATVLVERISSTVSRPIAMNRSPKFHIFSRSSIWCGRPHSCDTTAIKMNFRPDRAFADHRSAVCHALIEIVHRTALAFSQASNRYFRNNCTFAERPAADLRRQTRDGGLAQERQQSRDIDAPHANVIRPMRRGERARENVRAVRAERGVHDDVLVCGQIQDRPLIVPVHIPDSRGSVSGARDVSAVGTECRRHDRPRVAVASS